MIDATPDLLRACRALLVAIDTDASQGGDLAKRLDKANPLSVEFAREAVAKALNLGRAD